jgi:hypothetical protein
LSTNIGGGTDKAGVFSDNTNGNGVYAIKPYKRRNLSTSKPSVGGPGNSEPSYLSSENFNIN